MSKLYFIPGSQDLYGRECLDQVAADCRAMPRKRDVNLSHCRNAISRMWSPFGWV